MNNNSKKKLMFAAMSGSPPQQTSTTSARESNKPTTVESGAIFRSVSMGVSEPPPLYARAMPSPTSFQKSHSTPIPTVRPSSPTDTSFAAPKGNEKEWVWTLAPQQVKSVPLFHPLERTAITVADLPLETITARISAFLKLQSIPAKYDDDQSRVACMTEGLLKFVIQLWQTNEASGGVVVEIQRRQGCCIAMQGIRHHLIEAIQTGTGMEAAAKPSRSTCRFVQDLLQQTGLPPPPEYMACSTAAVELSRRLLESNRLDSQRLGLESLCSLTNPTQVMLREADEVSHTILGDPSWHALLGRYFDQTKLDSNLEDKEVCADDSLQMDYDQGDFFGAMHLLALKVVSQAIESLVSSGKPIRLDFSAPFWRTILVSLYFDLTVASHRPLEAAWAIRCFRYLQSVQPELLQLVPSKRRLYESLIHAHDFGKQHHRSLEQETEQWMGRLGFVY